MKNALLNRCRMNIDEFRPLGDVVAETVDGPLIHIDNGANVLAVAHLDYVDWTRPKISGDVIKCPQLDDRLGVWTILDLLPKLGVKCDVLLTDSEEVGRSTAAHFKTAKRYNWMFQFDRRGTDVVMYDYHSDENAALCEAAGFEVSYGSFSDICKLDSLGISGFNFGVGYHREHTRKCRADLKDTARNALKFYDFWRANESTRLDAPESRWDRLEREWKELRAARIAGAAGGWSLDSDDWDRPGFVSHTAGREDWFPAGDDSDAIDAYNRQANMREYMGDDEWLCDCGTVNHLLCDYCEECRMPVDYALRSFR